MSVVTTTSLNQPLATCNRVIMIIPVWYGENPELGDLDFLRINRSIAFTVPR
jgi:hypothetical protein